MHGGHGARNGERADAALAQLRVRVAPDRVPKNQAKKSTHDRDLVDVELKLGDVVRMRQELDGRRRD